MQLNLLSAFKELFKGNANAYGVHIPEENGDIAGKKKKGRSYTKTEPIPNDAYLRHLKGELSLGIVPINEDSVVSFSAIDVDVYPLDPLVYLRIVNNYSLPLVGFRSKSGGLHLFCFYQKPIKAAYAHKAMNYYRQLLGLPEKTELFPKQTALHSNSVGNWINLPYFNANNTTRYAYDNAGKPLSFDKALELCQRKTTTYEAIKDGLDRLPMNSAPPCLQTVYITGAATEASHNRNKYLFNVGIYLKARFGDDFENKLMEVNKGLPDPLSESEIRSTVINTHKKGSYTYQCGEPCLQQYCDREICSEREFGRGSDSVSDLTFEKLTQIVANPPYYKWVINGIEMVFYSEADLRKQDKFTYYCMRHLHKCPHKLKDNVWVGILNKAFSDMEVVDASEDGNEFSEESQTRNLIEKFLTYRGVVQDLSKIRVGAVCSDDQFYYFRSNDLVQYIENETHSRVAEPNKLYAAIKALGAKITNLAIGNGIRVRAWQVSKTAFATELDEPYIEPQESVPTAPRRSAKGKTKSSAERVIERLTHEF